MSVKTHGSLFSGIGGFDLAAEWMGWDNKFHCEWNEFGQKVLKYYWPKAVSYGNIKETDFTIWRGGIDVLTGGFPCQPYSLAGKRKGKDDDRHLWPEMLRAIRELQPRWIVGENVFGLINWSRGLVFDEVQTDLEAAGYEVWPYVLPACAKNAPHRRDRVWFVAHLTNSAKQRLEKREQPERGGAQKESRTGVDDRITNNGTDGATPNTDNDGCNGGNSEHEINTGEGWEYAQRNTFESISGWDAAYTDGIGQPGEKHGRQESGQYSQFSKRNDWHNFPTQSPVCFGDDGLSSKLDGITFPKWRNESIKAAGNAIVPQVVFEIFKAIEEYDRRKTKN